MRRCCADGVPGLGIRPGEGLEVTAAVDAFGTDVLVRREPGELYALRHDMAGRRPLATPVEGWVERLDPETLAVTASTPRLPGGAYWPGGIAAHANGDLHMVFGRWAHRLSPDLDVLASHELPVPRPHNSFVLLDGGELVTKDCDAPAGIEPSTVSVLDPQTLEPVAPALRLPEPSIARLATDGESVIAVGTTVVFRLRLDREAGRLARRLLPSNRTANIAVIEGAPGFAEVLQRAQGFKQALDEAHTRYRIVASQPGDWTAEKADFACQNVLAAHPEIDLFFNEADDMAVGCARAVRAAGSHARLVGIGGSKLAILSIKAGRIDGTVCYKPRDLGALAFDTLYKDVIGAKPLTAGFITYDTPGVTRADVGRCTAQW